MPQSFGDSFIVQTPKLDNYANRLYQQEQQRRQMGYQDWQATQQALQKEFANVRSADIPDVMKAYNDYKFSSQQLMFNHKLRSDSTKYAQAQQDALGKKAKLQQLINGSIDQKDQDKNIGENILKNRDLYNDDAGTTLSGWMQLPLSERTKKGYTSETPLLYQGSNTDFGALEKTATGTPTTTYQPEALSADGLSYEQKGFTHTNNPLQFYNLYSGQLAKRQAGKDTSAAYKQIPDEVKQETEKEFNELPDSYWQGYGIPKPTLSQSHGQSDAEKFAILKAQQYALANQPQVADTKTRENKGAILQAQLQNEKTMEGIRQGNRVSLAKLKEQYRQADKQSQGNFVNGYVEQLKQDAIKNGVRTYKNANGQTEEQYAIKASPETKKLFEQLALDNTGKQIKIYPDEIRFLKNGDVLPVYLSGEKNKNGRQSVDETLSTPVSADEFKLLLAKQFSTTQTNKAMNDDGNDDENDNDVDDNTPVQTSTKQTSGGYTNITETNKGTIGVKNGKWYDIKTGKPIQ